MDEGVAGDLVGEPSAAIAQNTTLAIEQNDVRDRNRLLVMPLFLDESTLARTM